jgi:hypothetical protein
MSAEVCLCTLLPHLLYAMHRTHQLSIRTCWPGRLRWLRSLTTTILRLRDKSTFLVS